jgi:hypothetical protein
VPYPVNALAVFNQVLWDGPGLLRLVDPGAVDDEAVDTCLSLR